LTHIEHHFLKPLRPDVPALRMEGAAAIDANWHCDGDAKLGRLKAALLLSIKRFQGLLYTYRTAFY
jgi:hypothetical protein